MKNWCFYECGEDNCNCEEDAQNARKCHSESCHILLTLGIATVVLAVVAGLWRCRR